MTVRHRNWQWSEKKKLFKEMGYEPHEYQIKVHSSDARYIMVVAGTRGGKSFTTAHEALVTFFLPDARIWLVGQQYNVADKEFDWIEERLLSWRIEDKSAVEFFGINIHKPKFGSRRITSPWGSYIETKSCKEPEKLLGVELDLIVLCEPHHIAWKIWQQMLRGRLASRKGRVIGAATGCGYSTLMRKFLQRGKSEEEKWSEWYALSYSSDKNPYFPKEEFEAAREELDEKIFLEQFGGQIVDIRGNVFDVGDESIIPLEKISQHKNWPHLVAYLHRSNNPSVSILVAIQPKTKDMYVVDELEFKKGSSTVLHFEQIIEMCAGLNMVNQRHIYTCHEDKMSRKIICDNKFVDMTNEDDAKIGKQDRLKLRIHSIQDTLNREVLFLTDNTPRLFDALLSSRWPEDKSEESGQADSEIPLSAHLSYPLALANIVTMVEAGKGFDYYTMFFD